MGNIPLFIPKNIDKYFYNRDKDIKKINFYLNGLHEDISQQLLITGYRGVGKTFLIHKIIKDIDSNFLITYIDISLIYSENDGTINSTVLLTGILSKINQTLEEKNNNKFAKITSSIRNLITNIKLKKYDFNEITTILDIPIPHYEDDYTKISKFVMELPQKIVDKTGEIDGFIIILDEIQMLKQMKNSESFFWLIRSHNQFQTNVSYILTGSTSKTSEIIEMINGETGAFGGRMIQINIDPFTKEETHNYFKDRMPEIQFTENGFDRFYECTRGIPAYINSFYNVLSSDVIYDDKQIKNTFNTSIDQILVMWIKIWGTLNQYEKKIIITILENEESTWNTLYTKTEFSTSTINKYLNSLQNKGIVSYKNKLYVLEDQMIKAWLEHEKETRGFYAE
ncbi:MAG: ATPase [Methanosphaera sp. rholeuAM6]|nr:MAG: ATPase [Methanosphaera sp. rholeuAM6]